MGELYSYISSFFGHWVTILVGGSLFGITEFAENFWPWLAGWVKKTTAQVPPQLTKYTTTTLLVLGVFYAGFQAWKDEHEARLIAEGKSEYHGRILSADEIAALAASLSKIRDEIVDKNNSIMLCWPQFDEEAAIFRSKIAESISRAGAVPDSCGVTPSGPDDVGVSIRVIHPDSPPQVAQDISKAFGKANINAPIEEIHATFTWKGSPGLVYYIFVGPMPIQRGSP